MNKILIIAALLLILTAIIFAANQRKYLPNASTPACVEQREIRVLQENDVPQAAVWGIVKTAMGEGYELFSFGFTKEGAVNIRAVKNFVCSEDTVILRDK